MTEDGEAFPSPARDAAVLGDLVARERRAPGTALRAFPPDGPDRTYSYRDLATIAWKAGNFLRYLGVRGAREAADPDDSGRVVEVAPDPLPEPVATVLGAALLGAVVRLDPRGDGAARATVVHADDQGAFDPPPGTKLAVYGGEPARPGVEHWETAVWSENPRVHPATVEPGDAAILAGSRYAHRDLLGAARGVVDSLSLAAGDRVAVRASLADPRAVVAGVLAPLLAGGTVVLPDEEARGTVAVGGGPEPRALALDDVEL
ncbi:MAG: acetyl-CoA synthetase [Haloferacaceae archaeon]